MSEMREVQSSGQFIPYATVSDTNLRTVDPTGRKRMCRAIYVGDADGTLVVKDDGGNTRTLAGLKAGVVLPIKAAELVASGSDVTNIIVMW